MQLIFWQFSLWALLEKAKLLLFSHNLLESFLEKIENVKNK